MNVTQDRNARRRQQTAARRKSGRAASVRARKRRQRLILRSTAFGSILVAVLVIGLVIVSSGGDDPPPGASHDIAVVAHDFNFSPQTLLGLAGPVNFTMTNEGLVGHNFIVLEQGVRISSATQFDPATELGRIESLAPGFDASLSLDLAPGTYQVVCLIPNHLEQGSSVDLIVS